MKLIPDWLKRICKRVPRVGVVVAVIVLVLTAGGFVLGHYKGAKYAGVLTMVVLYLLHQLVGAGAGFTILRLWPYRNIPLIRSMAVYMHAAPIGALTAIVLLFMSKGVTLTWKFSITLFVGTLLADLVRIPFVLEVIRGLSTPPVAEPGQEVAGVPLPGTVEVATAKDKDAK